MDLIYDFQTLLPKIIKWAEDHSEKIQKEGLPLTKEQHAIAIKVGVSKPEKVRIQTLNEIPFPADTRLNEAAIQTGFLSQEMNALTLDHSIYIRSGYITNRLLSHELRHVYQYETLGSLREFLVEYLKQIVLAGYENSLLERDARNHEIVDD